MHVKGANRLDEYAEAFDKLVTRRAAEQAAGGRPGKGRGYQGREENRRYGRGASNRGAGKGGGKPTATAQRANLKGGGRANSGAIGRLHFEVAAPAPPAPTLKSALKANPKHFADAQAEQLLTALLGPEGASTIMRPQLPAPR